MRRRALICGIGGQDGAYLASFLLEKGYEVIGTSRDAERMSRHGLRALGISDQVPIASMAPNDYRSVLHTITQCEPTEIYNLAGQTSVSLSFEQPVETIDSIAIGTLNLLEAMRFTGWDMALFNAGSGECFGETGEEGADESAPFYPRSPYAVAKACSHNLVNSYRMAYDMYAVTGIMFNHESMLRPARFVTQKIVQAAARIKLGSAEKLSLGNLEIWRDWGWAPEYVEAMWMMLQQPDPEDFVIATGQTASLKAFTSKAFEYFGLDWTQHVVHDDNLMRPADIEYSAARPLAAAEVLGWKASKTVDDVVYAMCHAAKMRSNA